MQSLTVKQFFSTDTSAPQQGRARVYKAKVYKAKTHQASGHKKRGYSLCLLLMLTLLSADLLAANLPKHTPYPGGIFHLPLTAPEDRAPEVIFQGHQVMVLPSASTEYAQQANWVALVGVPLSAKVGAHEVSVNGMPLDIDIRDKHYKEQHITIKNKRKVNPTQLDMERIRREKKEILSALASWSTDHPPVTRLLKPAEGPYSSPFGLRRFFNEQPRKPHSGIDIAAPTGTPIIAPAAGKVVAQGDYFFNGRTVILDHGHGLTTLYCHMDSIDVELGEKVQAGEPIGTIGSTGRVTGPHLHWSVSLNNARINPFLLMTADTAE